MAIVVTSVERLSTMDTDVHITARAQNARR